MVTKYSGYIHTPATRATGYVEDPNGTFVPASDYDALDEALNECIKDRDWFSDRLDAATAELARVKAESLRVVADECKNMDIASDWYMTPDGLGWLGYDRHNCECVETPHGYHKFDDCRKVKLERWEATIHPLQSLADNQVPPVPEFDAIAAEHFDELIGGVDT